MKGFEAKQKEQQLETVLGILQGIDLKTVSPEGMATATSLVISLSHYALSLSQSLPVERRMAIESQVKQVIETLERAVVKAQEALVEQERREKENYKQQQLIANQPAIFEALQKLQQNPSSPEALAALKAVLTENLSPTAAQEFTQLQNVMEIPAIAEEFVPFVEKANLVSQVFTPVETAQFLVRDTVVNGTHQVLTNYVGNESVMPDLTRSMLDNFRNVDQNRRHIEQCAVLEERLQQRRQELLATAPVDVVVIDRMIVEAKNTRTVATTAIHKEEVGETFKFLGSVAELVAPVDVPSKEEGTPTLPSEEAVELRDIGRTMLKILQGMKKERSPLLELLENAKQNLSVGHQVMDSDDLQVMKANIQSLLDNNVPTKKTWLEREIEAVRAAKESTRGI